MKRTLKFRIWNKKSKVFISNVIFDDVRPVLVMNSSNYTQMVGELDDYKNRLIKHDYDPEDWVIQQYTGVNDSENKPIFEGDILDNYDGMLVDGIVYFDRGAFGVALLYDCTFVPLSNFDPFQRKIINNIFEKNP
jgi:uncharacterized phage protein (TIGR01671 family)